MNRTLRSVLCAASMLALGAAAANAQTAPATTTTTTTSTTPTFTLPAACDPSVTTAEENHGQAVRDCVDALRAEAPEGDGLGQWVSDFASDDAAGAAPTSGSNTTSNTATTSSTSITSTSPSVAQTEHGHGHGHHAEEDAA